jgi:hypothetical protein
LVCAVLPVGFADFSTDGGDFLARIRGFERADYIPVTRIFFVIRQFFISAKRERWNWRMCCRPAFTLARQGKGWSATHAPVPALAFCGDEELTDDEKDTCYWNVIRTFKAAYSREKVASICTEISEPYRQYCAYQ